MNVDNNNFKPKSDFKNWNYHGKFNFQKNRKTLISNSFLENYLFLSNNSSQSVNNCLNNYIAINYKVLINRFESILKILFLSMNYNNIILVKINF